MKKIFILTGEPSGDKLAAKVISKLKIKDPSITYLCLGGEELKSLGINSISKLSEVTYLGFTRVLLNLFTYKKFFLLFLPIAKFDIFILPFLNFFFKRSLISL